MIPKNRLNSGAAPFHNAAKPGCPPNGLSGTPEKDYWERLAARTQRLAPRSASTRLGKAGSLPGTLKKTIS